MMRSILGFVSVAALLAACGAQRNAGQVESRIDTVDIDHTQVKWQSIGNCWAYSHMGWAESIIKKATGQVHNFSESYHTYRHYEEQLLNQPWLTELSTGGNFGPSMRLVAKYGLLEEGQFIPGEADVTKSATQASATAIINESLKDGLLKTDRSPATVRAELNRAFGITNTQFTQRSALAKKPTEFVLGQDAQGHDITLADHARQWREIYWDADSANEPNNLPAVPHTLNASRVETLKRVKRALNAGYPVILNWFVDFNALDNQGIFSLEKLQENGAGRQGYHSTVMEDYVVEGTDPATGQHFEVGEGEATPAQKELAAEFGNIKYIVLKNSWGGAERLDRTSYSRFGEKGYHRLEASYLFSWLPTVDEDDHSVVTGSETVVNSFVLPPGF